MLLLVLGLIFYTGCTMLLLVLGLIFYNEQALDRTKTVATVSVGYLSFEST